MCRTQEKYLLATGTASPRIHLHTTIYYVRWMAEFELQYDGATEHVIEYGWKTFCLISWPVDVFCSKASKCSLCNCHTITLRFVFHLSLTRSLFSALYHFIYFLYFAICFHLKYGGPIFCCYSCCCCFRSHCRFPYPVSNRISYTCDTFAVLNVCI